MLGELKDRGIKRAIGSSSKNAPRILSRIGLQHCFDVVVDGNMIKKSKPDPEVFLLAAKLLGVSPEKCVVVEDAEAGIEAAAACGMRAVGVGEALRGSKKAQYHSNTMAEVRIAAIVAQI